MHQNLARADITVLSSQGAPLALVEVKNREALTRDVAIILRRNRVAHGLTAHAPFFLLISQDRGFLWDHRAVNDPLAPPVAEFTMIPVIRRYLPQSVPEDRLRGAVLDLVVLQWLSDLSLGKPELHDEPERTLNGTGFMAGIQSGTVHAELAA